MENVNCNRKPNFKIDNEVYGKFGEQDFKEYYESKGYIVEDVSNNLGFQLADIDFLISKSPIPMHKFREIIFSRDSKGRQVYKAEVKTDTRSFTTRNVVYEVISHDFAGCMAESKADFIYYVFVDDSGGEIVKKETWVINLTNWRQYLREKFFDAKVSLSESESQWGIRRNNYNTNDDAVANLLCNIDKLGEHGVAKKVFG